MTAIATVNQADAFNFSKATLYKSDGDILEIKVPWGWQIVSSTGENGAKIFDFRYGGTGTDAPVSLQLQIVDATLLYAGIDDTGKVNSPQSALQSIINVNSSSQAGSPAIKFTALQDVKVGNNAGKGFIADVPGGSQGPEFKVDLRIVSLTG